jgi:hypothetical protein
MTDTLETLRAKRKILADKYADDNLGAEAFIDDLLDIIDCYDVTLEAHIENKSPCWGHVHEDVTRIMELEERLDAQIDNSLNWMQQYLALKNVLLSTSGEIR